ncbi:MAG: D-alanyl-D-alanine carboxypeptidase/D-alanyl-D-alanine-endopeptidase [Acidobacteriia bacterium]|nr:D-alanyl-D-alanine carboxypeptidase/D-alanyl-D-alanine-endopeptidase [Terriglobia bacterium]
MSVLRSWRGRGAALALGAWLGGADAGYAQQPPAAVKDAAQPVYCAAPGAAGAAAFSPEAKKRFADDAEKLLGAGAAGKAEWGVLAVDAQSGETLYQRAAENYFVPASNLKLFTTALALARLGPDYRFRTTLETRGALSGKGRLAGDLVLVGRGDPNLSSRKFPFVKEAEFDGAPEKALAELANQAVARGLREVRGDVVADDSYFPRERYPSGWEVDDLVWSYGAAVSAIVVNDNTVTLRLAPGAAAGKPAAVTLDPWTRDFSVRNEVRTSPPGTKPDLTLTREPGAPLVVLRGSYPLKGEPRKMLLAIEEPAEHAAALLKRLLEERGVRVRGTARAQHEPAASNGAAGSAREPLVLAEHLSVPLADAVQAVNKMSENLHTELLLRAAARQKGPWSTAEDLAKFAAEFYAEAGIAAGDVIQTDGSGLSRHDLVTPRAVVTLLQYAARQPWFAAYYASLPVAGADGTLLERLKNTPAAGRIHAKTGSVEHVRSLSGFAELPGGRQVIFSILSNNQGAKNHEATAALDALCVALVEDLGPAAAAQ